MKKMTIEQENALRATAKRCNDELKAAMAKKPKSRSTAVDLAHHTTHQICCVA